MVLEVLIGAVVDGDALEYEARAHARRQLLVVERYVLGHVQYVHDAVALQLVHVLGVELVAQVQVRHDLRHGRVVDVALLGLLAHAAACIAVVVEERAVRERRLERRLAVRLDHTILRTDVGELLKAAYMFECSMSDKSEDD